MEENQDVIAESSPAAEETTPEAVVETPTTPEAEASAPEVKEELPKDNRPIENVAWESKRKVDELYSTVNELKTMLQQRHQEPQTPTYSKAQLLTYAQSPEVTTEQRLWAYGEVDKLEKEERRKEFETLVTSTREKSEAEARRGQAANWVAQAFPDMVVKDPIGNPVGWNHSHPVLMKANEYMQRNKSLREDPEGFAAAVKLAAFDMGVTVNKQLSQKVDRTIGQLRKEQKKQLASAGGTRQAENPANASQARYEKLKKQYSETGDREVFAELVKMRKLNPFV
jgi:hypothetical protein